MADMMENHAPEGFADAHLHMTEAGFPGDYPDIGDAGLLLSCTAERREWEELRSISDPRVRRFYGIHPWYAEEQWNGASVCELRGFLEMDPKAGVGEIGLDIKRVNMDDQIPAFTNQLSLAAEMCRPVAVHMVGCEKETLDSIRMYGKGCSSIILHGFSSSESYVKPFSDLCCYFSIGPRILKRSEERVGRLLRTIPKDRLLLETDAPHQGEGFQGMLAFAERMARIIDMNPSEVLEFTLENTRRALDG